MFNKASKPKTRIDTLIGAGTSIIGDISFSGGLHVDGEIKGNVRADGTAGVLIVSENAQIQGEVDVAHAIINGTVVGPVRSSDFLELQAKARITGDIEYSTIEMHLGAVVQGRLVHQGAPAKAVELKLASNN